MFVFSLSDIVAKCLIRYHAACVDITNCLGQLHLISAEEWERRNCDHVMALVNNPQINRNGLFLNDDEKES